MAAKTTPVKYLPEAVGSWKKSDQDLEYTPVNLYKYINGGAELFLSYDFQTMAVRRYARPENPEITINVDIFDMGNSYNAFGVFSQGCETCDKNFGQGSQYSSGLLTFWKGKYYVSVLSYPETEEKKEVIFKIGRHITAAIREKGELPPLISRLPAQGLVKESIRYFRHYIWLNSFYFISNDNILHIDKDTHVALAKYREENDRYFVLLLLYPGQKKAESAYNSFLKNYLPGGAAPLSKSSPPNSRIVKIEDGKWTACYLKEKLVIILLNVDSEKRVHGVYNKINEIL